MRGNFGLKCLASTFGLIVMQMEGINLVSRFENESSCPTFRSCENECKLHEDEPPAGQNIFSQKLTNWHANGL